MTKSEARAITIKEVKKELCAQQENLYTVSINNEEDITYVKQLIANIDELKITLFVLNYLDDKEKENELY